MQVNQPWRRANRPGLCDNDQITPVLARNQRLLTHIIVMETLQSLSLQPRHGYRSNVEISCALRFPRLERLVDLLPPHPSQTTNKHTNKKPTTKRQKTKQKIINNNNNNNNNNNKSNGTCLLMARDHNNKQSKSYDLTDTTPPALPRPLRNNP